MKRCPLILLAFFCGACATKPIPWTGGLPPSGAGLSNDQRMKEYARFIPSQLNTEGISIHQDKKEVVYQYETYRPVLQALDPTIEARVISADRNDQWNIGLVFVGTLLTVRAAGKDIDKLHRYGALSLAGLVYVAERFFSHEAAEDREAAMRTIRTRLDQRLFP